MSYGQPSAVPCGVSSPIVAQSEELLNQAERLSKTAAMLESRLGLILQPRAVGASASMVSTAISPKPKSQHLARLEDVIDRNNRSISDLENLMSYLDI